MRIAALFDIHGNLPALEAVLDEVSASGADAIVVGGDVFPGPMPVEVLSRLDALQVPVWYIRGNGDRVVMAARSGGDISEVPPAHRDVIEWGARQLPDDGAARLFAWPATRTVEVTGLGSVLFCHATPRSDTEIFTRLTPEARLRPAFAQVPSGVVLCGHTHMPFDRKVDATRVINPGSVGMPFGAAGAYWALLGPGVELRRTAYDLARAAERIRGTQYPRAEEFAARHVLQPPTETEMLEAFERVARR